MKKLNLDEIKKIELNVLIELDKIMKEHDFRYSLCGGTLLGAIRHKGFIPWDDDIDIFMPRVDYDKLINYFLNNDTKIKLICHKNNASYKYLFAKVYDPNTKIIELNGNNNCEMGVYVDIFPIDGLGDSISSAKRILRKMVYKKYLLVAANWNHYFKSKTRGVSTEIIRLYFYLASRRVNVKKLIVKLEKITKKYEYDNSLYVGCICGVYGNKEIIEKKYFDKLTDIEFENHIFKAVKGYDKYLNNLYGDYMKLPLVEKRITHHTFDAYIKD